MAGARDVVVVGAGGFGREVLDVMQEINRRRPAGDGPWRLAGVLDDAPSAVNSERLRRRMVPLLGSVDDWTLARPGCLYVVGVGSPRARADIAQRLDARGLVAATFIHPSASIGSHVEIGRGSVICAGVAIGTNVSLGEHVHVNANATIGHDTIVGAVVSINPAAVVSGDCQIDSGSLLGAGSVVLEGRRVGHDATVGAAACVTRDVLPGAVVRGLPAR